MAGSKSTGKTGDRYCAPALEKGLDILELLANELTLQYGRSKPMQKVAE